MIGKKGQHLIGQAIVFFIVWLIAGLIWSIWLDGIFTAVAGCLTSLALLGLFNIVINIGGK